LVSFTKEFKGMGSVIRRASTGVNSILNVVSERVLSIEMPHSLEMNFLGELLWHLMWVKHVFWLDQFWGHSAENIEISLELLSSFFGGGVNTKVNWLLLVTVSERVENFISVLGIKMSVMSVPPWLWDLIIEESGGVTLTELLESEPLEWVWFLSFSKEWSWSTLGVEFVHGIIPGLSGIAIEFPSDGLGSLGPVWNLVSLEDGSWSSVEGNISDSFEEGRWMEILSIYVMHVVWLLEEFLMIEILNPNTYIIVINLN
jgi:hypothetical protein